MMNNMRLIDADAFVKWIERQKRLAKITTIMAIQETHTIDAVPVVRCKDCKYWEKIDNGTWCHQGRIDGTCRQLVNRWAEQYMTTQDDFCSYGERKE